MPSKQASTPQLKLHKCQKCPRSFATEAGANAHSRDTGHLIPCTIAGCQRGFVSDAALAAHLSSATHSARNNTSKKWPKMEKAAQTNPRPKISTPAKPGNLLFQCTAPGCSKTFETAQARWQHLDSPFHKEQMNEEVGREVVEAVRPVRQNGAAGLPAAAQLAVARGETTKKGKKIESIDSINVRGEESIVNHEGASHVPSPTAKAGKNAVHLTTGAQSSRPKLSSLPRDTEPPRRDPLFRWDTRWSAIPTTGLVSTLIALKAHIPSPEAKSSAPVDKKYWTLDQKSAPAQVAGAQKRLVITLDCEMVGTGPQGSVSELARLSALDFFTGELLIDSLVRPLCEVTDWRTRYSGITAENMAAAIQAGEVLEGSPAARTELFKYMDVQTVLVGHALHHDLAALGIRHTEIVDSSALAQTAVGGKSKRGWGLKTLCKELLGIVIQDDGREGHDAVEDALGAREVVLWCLQHERELKEWGSKKRKEGYANKGKSKKKPGWRRHVRRPQLWYDYEGEDEDEDEYCSLSLREFNELCGYPEWYDNWSD
ncbi:exonuclease [Stagonosporopsis vannaccii]|nr:exonuclease [Stagonosporopsis vannaccii]